VPVVATGIDHIVTPNRSEEARLAELTEKLQADSRRIVANTEAAPAPRQPAPRASIDQAAAAAVAAAMQPTTTEEVTIRPIAPKPSLFVDPPAMAEPAPQEMPKAFIPPQPERAVSRTPRMPRIDEFPIPAQNEMRAKRGELPEEHPEKRRMSLLQRLASVGMGRRESDGPENQAPRMAGPQHMGTPNRPQMPQAPRPEPVSEYARRPAPQGLDMHGRQAPVQKAVDDDQLDIPAFLRRQSN
jgi:cell division protein FtsZ